MNGHRLVDVPAVSYPMESYFDLDESDTSPRISPTYRQYTTPYTNIPFYLPCGQRPPTIRRGDTIWAPKSCSLGDEEQEEQEKYGEGEVFHVREYELKQQRDAIDVHTAHKLFLSDRVIIAEQAALISSQTLSAPTSPISPIKVPPDPKTHSVPVVPVTRPLMGRSTSAYTGPSSSRPRPIIPRRSRSCPSHHMLCSARPPARQVRFDTCDSVNFQDEGIEMQEEMSLWEYFSDWKEEDKRDILGRLLEGSIHSAVAYDFEIEEITPSSTSISACSSYHSSAASDVLDCDTGAGGGPQVGVVVPVG